MWGAEPQRRFQHGGDVYGRLAQHPRGAVQQLHGLDSKRKTDDVVRERAGLEHRPRCDPRKRSDACVGIERILLRQRRGGSGLSCGHDKRSRREESDRQGEPQPPHEEMSHSPASADEAHGIVSGGVCVGPWPATAVVIAAVASVWVMNPSFTNASAAAA